MIFEGPPERVVVTGLGVVSPAAVGLEAFWRSVLRGSSYVRNHTHFPKATSRGRAAAVAEFEPETCFSWSRLPGARDRLFCIGEAAITEALNHAGLLCGRGEEHLAGAGLYLSSAVGPIAIMEALVRDGDDGTDDESWRSFSFGHLAARLAGRCGLGGPYAMLPTGCAGGCDAVGYGLTAVRSGVVDRAVVAGIEAPITPLVEAAFARIRATSSRDCPAAVASCPFDTRRDGFVLGEGGAALVLELESAALARGWRPLAVLAGYGSASSAFHMTDIHAAGEAIARSIALALEDAGLGPGEIDHVNLHGSSTAMNDVAEANALRSVLGESAARVPVTSLKSQIGHALAAAGAIELAAAVMTVCEQQIPPTVNLIEQDPRVGLDVVSGGPRRAAIRTVLKTGSGFGGIHSSVLVRRYEL